VALTQARFTADGNPALNINAGLAGDCFFLATGGKTKNEGTRLGNLIHGPPAGIDLPNVSKFEKQ